MGHQRDHAPAAAKAAEKHADPIERGPALPLPVPLDSARTASLMLRQLLVSGQRADQSGGIGQAIAFTRRLEDVLHEIRALEKLQPGSVGAVGVELARVRVVTTSIAARLSHDEKLSAFAADVLAELDALDAPSAGPLAAAPPARDLLVPERLELVRLELAAARAQVGKVLSTHPKTVDEAARVCAPLKGHLDEARNAALGIADRSTREPLFADVDQVSHELDDVERVLTLDPRFAWHASFAGAFDAENRLRSAVGLPGRARAYSGVVDPLAAAERVRKALEGAGTGAQPSSDPATATPQESLDHIGLNLASTYECMHDELTAFHDAFEVQDPPSLSLGDMLVNAAVATVLDVATAGVAAFMGNALGKALGPAVASSAAHDVEEIVVEGNVIPAAAIAINAGEHAATRNASANDAIKGRVNGIMKAGTSKAQITAARPTSSTLLNHFVASAIARVTDEKLTSLTHIVDLGAALAQLDPAALRALDTEMRQRVREPAVALHDRAVVEYERLRTENALAARKGYVDPLLDAKHLGVWRDEDIAGVLEIGLNVTASNQVTFDHLRLQGGEPAARRWLHDANKPVRGLGLHRVFHVRFDAAKPTPGFAGIFHGRDYLTFAVGATEGLQLETINEQEWLWLRLLVADRPVDDLHALALELRDLDAGPGMTPEAAAAHLRDQIEQRTSCDAAFAKVRSLIAFGDTLSTDKVDR